MKSLIPVILMLGVTMSAVSVEAQTTPRDPQICKKSGGVWVNNKCKKLPASAHRGSGRVEKETLFGSPDGQGHPRHTVAPGRSY